MNEKYDYFVYRASTRSLTLYKDGKMIGGLNGPVAELTRNKLVAEGRKEVASA